MKSLKHIFSKPKPLDVETIEWVPITKVSEAARLGKATCVETRYVKNMDLNKPNGVQAVADELCAGNIVIIDIGSMMKLIPNELKRAIDQLKGICQGIGGDMGRISDTKIIATPNLVKLKFRRTQFSYITPGNDGRLKRS